MLPSRTSSRGVKASGCAPSYSCRRIQRSVWQQAHTLQETLKRQRAFGQKHLREKRKLAERRKAYDWANQRTQF
jgi:hypothetical protein